MENQDGTIICPNCGSTVNKSFFVCPNCRYKLNSQWPPDIYPKQAGIPPANKNIADMVFGGIIGFLCIIPGLVIAFVGPAAILILCLVKNINPTFKKSVLAGACIAVFVIIAAIGSCFGMAFFQSIKR